MGIDNLVVSTCEKSVVDRDIRLAVNRSVIYFESTKLAEFINQL